ncbi:MAG: hypothetical protein IPP91_01590 [Betaproteobacteria bacterium]|nr:hypothetical protein [Betaproteobacteria bacterium]
MKVRAASATVLVLLALMVAGCGKKESPPTDAATEQKEALERAKKGAFGTQVKALEDAKGLGADLDRKARESVEKAEQDTK